MQYHDDATTPYTSRALLYPGVEETARVGSFASHPANPRDCWFAFAVPQQWYQVAIEECISGLYHTRVGYPTVSPASVTVVRVGFVVSSFRNDTSKVHYYGRVFPPSRKWAMAK